MDQFKVTRDNLPQAVDSTLRLCKSQLQDAEPKDWERYVGGVIEGVAVGGTAIAGLALAPPLWATVAAFGFAGYGGYSMGNGGYQVATGNQVDMTEAATGRTLTSGDRAELAGQMTPGAILTVAGAAYSVNARLSIGSRRIGPIPDGITQEGVTQVEQYLSQFGPDAANEAMIARLKAGDATAHDLNFYAHELHESMLMQQGMEARAAHLRTLESQGISYKPGYESQLYHPDVIRQYPEQFNPAAWPK